MPDDFANAVIKYPAEALVYHNLATGETVNYPIYRDDTTQKDLVVCDLCSKFLVIGKGRSTSRIENHRKSVTSCKAKARRQDSMRKQRPGEDFQPRPLPPAMTGIHTSSPTNTPSTYFTVPSSQSFAFQPMVAPSSFTQAPLSTPAPQRSQILTTPITQLSSYPYTPNAMISTPLRPLMLANNQTMICCGQWIRWYPGSVWETYAYQLHTANDVNWRLIAVDGDEWVRLRSLSCSGKLFAPQETAVRTCLECQALGRSAAVQRMMERAKGDPKPHTPWKYLNHHQLTQLLHKLKERNDQLEQKQRQHKRAMVLSKTRLNNYRRIIMMISQNKIPGVSRILAVCIRNGASAVGILDKLQKAIDGVYRPKGGWSDREISIAFLTKALGGTRLLYVMQKAEGYPSNTALKAKKKIPELIVSVGQPSRAEMQANIKTFFGPVSGRMPPSNRDIGLVLMIDGVALEEACRYDHLRGLILGICREHSTAGPAVAVHTIEDIERIEEALLKGIYHHSRDGTVAAVGPLTAEENYFPTPALLSGSCKAEKGAGISGWVEMYLNVWSEHPDGEARHGPIVAVATDGESSFRLMRFSIGLLQATNPTSKLGLIIYKIPGLNCYTGLRGLITTCDPKHIVKRCATMVRSSSGILIGHTTITAEDFNQALIYMNNLSIERARALLNPVDKQNVPNAVNLLQSLSEETKDSNIGSISATPTFSHRIRRIHLIAKTLSFFLLPFIDVALTLSQQIRMLSTYSHLVTAFYRKHHTSFMSSALFADSQAIIKNIIITVVRLQLIDGKIKYYIILEGTDRLEGVFSHTRTQDHARNFDILQLAHKLAVGAEINAIFERYPDLYQGHIRRNLVGAYGIDHVNPKSWVGNVEVGAVDVQAEYLAGRADADAIMREYLSEDEWNEISLDWDKHFSNPTFDHLRPDGDYIGSSIADDLDPQCSWDDDSEELIGNLVRLSSDTSTCDERARAEDIELRRPDEELHQEGGSTIPQESDEPMLELLNPSADQHLQSPYLILRDGTRVHIDTIVSRSLVSNRARKSIIRTLRVRDVTLSESIRPDKQLNSPNDDSLKDPEDLIKFGDLGGFLVQTANQICLAVGEALHFRQGNSNRNLTSVKFDELETPPGLDASITVAVQVLQLRSLDQGTGPHSNPTTWTWAEDFIRLQDSKSGLHTEKQFTAWVAGQSFIPLAPSVETGPKGKAVWSLMQADLQAALDEAWDTLNPDSDDLVRAIESLPKVTNKLASIHLPYRSPDGAIAFVVEGAETQLPAQKLSGKDSANCKLCGSSEKISKMRNHVGKHILQAFRSQNGRTGFSVGINPCGWCGSEGCKTLMTLKKRAKNPVISSNCPYHYANMIYSKATKYSAASPCTNIPIVCPLCPVNDATHPQSFWKYNLIYHMTLHHLDEDGKLPILPPDLRMMVHVSKLEELDLGINIEDTEAYRREHQLPNSDPVDVPPDVQSPGQESMAQESDSGFTAGTHHSEDVFAVPSVPLSRRRTFSFLSTTSSSSSRAPPPAKMPHIQ